MDNYGNESMSPGIFAGISAVGGIIYLAILVLMIVGLWRMFEKAGKPGWAAIVPVYNGIVVAEIVGKPLWWGVLVIIPCVGWVFGIWLLNLLMKSFGKDVIYTILAIFFPYIIFPILGFGKDRYIGPTAAEAQGQNSFDQFKQYKNPFDQNNNNDVPPTDPTV